MMTDFQNPTGALMDDDERERVRIGAFLGRYPHLVDQGTPAEVAAARVDASDRARSAYLCQHHGLRLDDPALYDLVINMAQLDVETAAALICQAAQRVAAPGGVQEEQEGCEA